MSNKLVKPTEEEKKRQEDEAYLKGRPNRAEVANYVNALLEEKYMPEIMNHFSQTYQSMQLGFMTLQAILVQKEICTGEEIEKLTQEFIKCQQAELEKKMKETADKVTDEVTK